MKLSPTDQIASIELDDIEYFLSNLHPQTYPKRHNTHKYWGKKPANVFKELIEKFSLEGETVLDPFSGSGVTVVEAALTKRKGIGVDLNPFAKVLGDALCHNSLEVQDFKIKATEICNSLNELESDLYSTTCRKCNSEVIPTSFSWEKQKFVGLRYRCKTCKETSFVKPNNEDKVKAKYKRPKNLSFPDSEIINGWETQKLLRAGLKNFSELLTDRNLVLCTKLIDLINNTTDTHLRNLLRITFTSNLAQCTKMIVDYKNAVNGGGPSWKINCYWLPNDWQELNVLHYFRNRITKTNSAITEMNSLTREDHLKPDFFINDSRDITNLLETNSVDYILTDPPYGGEGIQYGELSILWNTWLGLEQDLSCEVAENPYRNMSNDDYRIGLLEVFKECFRVLKPGRWMTLTFNNKDTKIWNSLLSACKDAGFELKTVSLLKRSAPSLTEHTMNDAPKSDMLIQFYKPLSKMNGSAKHMNSTFDMKQHTIHVATLIAKRKRQVTTESVLNLLTIEWLTHHYTSINSNNTTYDQISVSSVNKALLASQFSQAARVSDDKKFDNYIWEL